MELIGKKLFIGGRERIMALDLNALIAYARITGSEVSQGLRILESSANAKGGGANLEEKFKAIHHLLYASLTSSEKWKAENLEEDLHTVGNWLQPHNMMTIMGAIMEQANQANGAAEFENQLAPFVPSSKAVVEAVIRLAELRDHDVFLDLGAGDGRLLIAAAEANPTVKAIGYEAHLERARGIKALIRERKLGSRVALRNEDILTAAGDDIADSTVIYMYLLQGTTNQVFQLFRNRFQPGTKVITQDFTIEGLEPASSTQVTTEEGATHVLTSYVIETPAESEATEERTIA